MIFKNPTIKEIRRKTKISVKNYKHLLYIADYLTWFTIKLRLTPAQVTYFWAIGQFLALFLLLTKNYYWMVISILLYQILFIFDLVDGKLVRYLKSPSKHNLFMIHIDHIAHAVNCSLFFILLGVVVDQVVLGLMTAFVFVFYKAISLNPVWYREEQAKLIVTKFKESLPRHKANKLIVWFFGFVRLETLFSLVLWLMLFKQYNLIIPIYLAIFSLELIRRIIKQLILVWRTQ